MNLFIQNTKWQLYRQLTILGQLTMRSYERFSLFLPRKF